MKTKQILCTILIFTLSIALNGTYTFANPQKQKTKTVDSDKKKKPEWINTIKKDYLIITGSGSTLDDAQQNAMLKVKESIVRAVAENISITTESSVKEEMGTNISNYYQSFEQTTQAQTADISFIKGISINKAEDSWWEKQQTGQVSIVYFYILYPFSSAELHKLVLAFEKADKEMTDQLNNILNKIDNNNVVEDMETDISTLEKLKPKFFDMRKTQTEVGIEKLKGRVKSINIVPVKRTLGKIEYELKIGQQTVTTNRKPKVNNPTKCATVNGIEPTETGWQITFDAKYCYNDPGNLIKTEHVFKYSKVSHDFYFDINEGKVEIYIHAPIVIKAEQQDATNVKTGQVTFTISNKYDGSFIVSKIILNYAKTTPVIFENINKSFSGKGDHSLILDLPVELNKIQYSSKQAPLVDGFIYYTQENDQKQQTYKLYQNKITTNW